MIDDVKREITFDILSRDKEAGYVTIDGFYKKSSIDVILKDEESKYFTAVDFQKESTADAHLLDTGHEKAMLLFVGCLTSQQRASVSQGQICSDNLTCCHTEIEVADPTFHLTQSQYTDHGPTNPSTDPVMPRPGKIPSEAGFETQVFHSRGGRLNQ